MKVTICIGSSCHLKGSRNIVEKLQNLVEQYNLNDKLEIAGTFCLGKCNRDGVSVKIDDEVYVGISPDDFEEFFEKNILMFYSAYSLVFKRRW